VDADGCVRDALGPRFDNQILAALESANTDIHYEAVHAAGNWELDAAWDHIVELLNDPDTPSPCCWPPLAPPAASVPRRRG